MRRTTILLIPLFLIVAPGLAGQEHHHELSAEEVGSVRFLTSCSKAAQSGFNRAVALLHSFQYEQARQAFNEVAAEVGATPQQVTLAWMLAKGSRVIPIPGSSRPATATASAAAADLVLSPEQVTRLNAS